MKVKLTYYAVTNVNTQELEARSFVQREVYYNDEGNITKELQYAPDGVEALKIEQEYNERNKVIKREVWDQGELTESFTYEYDEDGQLVVEKLHYLDGSFDATNYLYEDKGLIKKVVTDDEGECEGYTIYTNENGLPVEITTYNYNDDLEKRVVISYYNGEVKERTTYDEYGEVEAKLINTYDENDRLIAQEHFSNYQSDNVTDKDLIYDEQGRHIKTIALDSEGNPEMQMELYFADDGLLLREEESIRGENGMVVNLKREYEYTG